MGTALPESVAPLPCGCVPQAPPPAALPGNSGAIASLSLLPRPGAQTALPASATAVVWRTAGSPPPESASRRRSLDPLRRRPVRPQPLIVLQARLRTVILAQYS